MNTPPLFVGRDYVQQAWVVPDLDVALRHWTEVCGVGPFFVLEKAPMENLLHRGKPIQLDCRVGIAQAGRTQIELIQQRCDSPSIYRDLVPKGQIAFHHMATFCSDYDRELAHYQSLGHPLGMTGTFGDMRFAYVDTSAALNCVMELLEDKPYVRDFFSMIAAAAVNWDGKHPVRPAS